MSVNAIVKEQSTEDVFKNFRVKKRDGRVVQFNISLIKQAIEKAFVSTQGYDVSRSDETVEIIASVIDSFTASFLDGKSDPRLPIDIELIQNKVEYSLMRNAPEDVARSYILYRHERNTERLNQGDDSAIEIQDGNKTISLNLNKIVNELKPLSNNINVDLEKLAKSIKSNLYQGASIEDYKKSRIMCARSEIEKEPDYSFLCARILNQDLREMVCKRLALNNDAPISDIFLKSLEFGVNHDLMDEKLLNFDLVELGKHLQESRDNQFHFLGLQTLYDRYFIHWNQDRFELPQTFFMRVAMGLSLKEDQPTQRAIEFYNLISTFTFMPSTPTLFNSGTCRSQLSSCYLTTVPDHLDGIYAALKDNANLSKYAGGLGNDWTNVRGSGSKIKGTNGISSGVIPFLNVADATAVAVNQGGKRKGAVCAYLESWHMDIEDFLELRKNTGDDRRRTHDMNTANWVPDLLMKRVLNNEQWTLFSPSDAPDLHDLYGEAFQEKYEHYEQLAQKGEIPHRQISAVKLWRKMLSMIFETGHPWITFKDPCNIRSPQGHAGVVHSSNLCTEITLNTSKDEIAVCNLGSINLPKHFKNGQLDVEQLKKTISTAVRMLDNVIDINYYSVDTARNSNFKHRPVGLGIMGFQDALYEMQVPYSSDKAVEFADTCMEIISHAAIDASSNLAIERGVYESYKGSLWSKGILPIDSIEMLKKSREQYSLLDQNQDCSLDWTGLREKIAQHGMRNSNVMAIAPTATIANICGVSQSIEPNYQNIFVKSNLSGEFTIVNHYLIKALKERDLWDDAMINDIKYFNGDLQSIKRIPEDLKAVFNTAFEIDPKWLIECASRRQKWIDQAQSLNLYISAPSGKKLDELYKSAWIKGLKTTYYLRSKGASAPERATVSDGALNSVPKQCSIDDPDCEACQ